MVEYASEAKGARAEIRRNQVIEAARECFRASGFHGASMAQIASAAGMSVGQIYRYFPSKEAVIAAIVEQGVAEKIDHMAALEAAARENGQDLAEASAQLSKPGPSDPGGDLGRAALTLEIIAEAARNPAVACIVQRSDAVLTARAAKMFAAARPHWSPERVHAVVQVVGALYEGWLLRCISDPEALNENTERLRAELVAHVMKF